MKCTGQPATRARHSACTPRVHGTGSEVPATQGSLQFLTRSSSTKTLAEAPVHAAKTVLQFERAPIDRTKNTVVSLVPTRIQLMTEIANMIVPTMTPMTIIERIADAVLMITTGEVVIKAHSSTTRRPRTLTIPE